MITVRFRLRQPTPRIRRHAPCRINVGKALWHELFDTLSPLPGVERITGADSGRRRGTPAPLVVTYNRFATPGPLCRTHHRRGRHRRRTFPVSRVGKQIVIPPVESG